MATEEIGPTQDPGPAAPAAAAGPASPAAPAAPPDPGPPAAPAPSPAPASGRRPDFTSRLPSLTGMRFPAALLVFFFHASLPAGTLRLSASDTAERHFAKLTEQAGGLGVTFFFVLSGFVLTWSAREGDTARSFWRRRYVKIVPNYVIAWGVALLAFAAADTTPWQGIATLFMLQAWIPDYAMNFSVNPPGWSLSAEAFFYLCFPLVFHRLRRIAPHRLKYATAAVVALVFAIPAVTTAVIPAGNVHMTNTPYISGQHLWFAYVLPPMRLLDFVLGILVARSVLTGRWRDIGVLWSGLLLVAAYALSEWSRIPYLYGQRAICLIPCTLLIAAGAVADSEGRFTLFRSRVMTWLGEVSFAFYLLHFSVLVTCRKLLGSGLFPVPVTALLLVAEAAAAVLVSWVLYRWVETPIVRRWSRPRRKPHPAAGPAGPAVPQPAAAPPVSSAVGTR